MKEKRMIDAIAQIVDMLKVVRCRDCKHCDPENHHCDHHMGTAAPIRRKPDDFCSYGERMDGAGMDKYIDREALIDWLKRVPLKDLSDGLGLCRVIMEDDLKRAIKEMPEGIIADAVQMRHGRRDEEVKDYPPYLDYPKPYKQQTNADRIRAMSDEELADMLWKTGRNYRAVCADQAVDYNEHRDHLIEWLQQPAEGG